jgi:ABC-2 type transport system ATP-binding protein
LIEANGLSMAYRSGKGVFGLSFAIKDGEAFGYLGPNGSGKTTTIRLLMGFMRPDSGQARIGGLDCWKDAAAIKSGLGFLPGENSLFEDMNGHSFLKFMLEMRGIRGMVRAKELSERFALDPAQKIRRMSKGTKQKLAIVAAFMHDPKAYILDEPTSGLDPLMQNVFIELVLEEKKRGKTFLMSSHNFEEIDRTCDRAAILKEGRLAAIEHISELKAERRSSYIILFQDAREIAKLKAAGIDVATQKDNQAEVIVGKDFNAFFKALAGCDVKGLYPGTKSLEDTFLKYYGGEVK